MASKHSVKDTRKLEWGDETVAVITVSVQGHKEAVDGADEIIEPHLNDLLTEIEMLYAPRTNAPKFILPDPDSENPLAEEKPRRRRKAQIAIDQEAEMPSESEAAETKPRRSRSKKPAATE